MPRGRLHLQGFSLIEVMTIIALIAIVLMLAIPNMSSMVRSNRATGEINQLGAALRYAKAEAIKRGSTVILCPTTDGTRCAEINNWESGWLIFNDINANGTLDDSEIIKTEQAFSQQDHLTTPTGTNKVKINRDGFAFDLPDSGVLTFSLTSTPADRAAQRCLQINISGNYSILKQGDTGCV